MLYIFTIIYLNRYYKTLQADKMLRSVVGLIKKGLDFGLLDRFQNVLNLSIEKFSNFNYFVLINDNYSVSSN